MKKAGYTKEQHEEAAGMGLEDAFLSHHEQPCDCAVCDDIAFRRSLRGKPYLEPAAMELLRQKVEKLESALGKIARGRLEPGHIYEQSLRMQDIAFKALYEEHGCTVLGAKVCFACGDCNTVLMGEHLARFEKWWDECSKKDWIQAKDYAQHAYIAGYGQSVERIEKWKCWYEKVSAAEFESRQRAQKFYAALQKIEDCDECDPEISISLLKLIAREALADRP